MGFSNSCDLIQHTGQGGLGLLTNITQPINAKVTLIAGINTPNMGSTSSQLTGQSCTWEAQTGAEVDGLDLGLAWAGDCARTANRGSGKCPFPAQGHSNSMLKRPQRRRKCGPYGITTFHKITFHKILALPLSHPDFSSVLQHQMFSFPSDSSISLLSYHSVHTTVPKILPKPTLLLSPLPFRPV